MGVARAPVVGSGCAPAWIASVLKPGVRSVGDLAMSVACEVGATFGRAGTSRGFIPLDAAGSRRRNILSFDWRYRRRLWNKIPRAQLKLAAAFLALRLIGRVGYATLRCRAIERHALHAFAEDLCTF